MKKKSHSSVTRMKRRLSGRRHLTIPDADAEVLIPGWKYCVLSMERFRLTPSGPSSSGSDRKRFSLVSEHLLDKATTPHATNTHIGLFFFLILISSVSTPFVPKLTHSSPITLDNICFGKQFRPLHSVSFNYYNPYVCICVCFLASGYVQIQSYAFSVPEVSLHACLQGNFSSRVYPQPPTHNDHNDNGSQVGGPCSKTHY